jgi:DnaJ-class molecular chaperone
MVKIQIKTPKSLTSKQKKLLEELSSLNGQSKPVFTRVELD